LPELQESVEAFRKIALLLYGNVKYAFKVLSRDAELLAHVVRTLMPVDEDEFRRRHNPVRPVDQIPGGQAYYLGYLIERRLRERLEADPHDPVAQAEERLRGDIVSRGISNHEAYLASDHLDVYVATSMREPHEFQEVSRVTNEIFAHPELRDLKLRWFDPTQAYCKDRIDKGLSEALMLRRAQCTIYLAQETDTLGKDSELASTLAQGKTVIAFVPHVDADYASRLVANLRSAYPDKSELDILLEQLQIYEPEGAWRDPLIRTWIEQPTSMDEDVALARLQRKISARYDARARTLKESHPLGIQVNLASGVANGVLVVRTVEQCAQLVKRILTRKLEFDLREEGGYLVLRERISGCVYRVMTCDMMLANSFWNFYLKPSE
jgi:hypothetical protein